MGYAHVAIRIPAITPNDSIMMACATLRSGLVRGRQRAVSAERH
jgi:hypothetical protein